MPGALAPNGRPFPAPAPPALPGPGGLRGKRSRDAEPRREEAGPRGRPGPACSPDSPAASPCALSRG